VANKVWNYGNALGAEVSLKDFRKEIIIEMYNEAGQPRYGAQSVSLLGVRLSSSAGFRCECERCRYSKHQARE
jgi:hypothetical protein